ncbi:protein shortage in chiasmata 1 ortholog [Sphaeramia orbicularis]|uniref:protein shortage in chiasmata 1 ortholog n=1 Tax=Sphaeramia orbicularis TaxID=375764 RepID=UPI00117EA7AC|nr:protein shortage in chiasmata 1 ortholog [Sphaeramia orbicularis]
MMNLLGLPTPYLVPGVTDLYPHSGNLAETTFRTPWVRGKVISTSKLFVSGSVLDDLGVKEQSVYLPERYNVSLSCLYDAVEVIPSSNPGSQNNLHLDDCDCLVKELKINNPCQESFFKWPTHQMNPESNNKSLLFPEEYMDVDYVKQFKRHLPTLKSKLSRLRTLPVSDPLLSLTGDIISEDTILRQCAFYEVPPDVQTSDNMTSTRIHEEFCKESLFETESLLLPDVLETVSLERENCTAFSDTCGQMIATPVQLNEELSILSMLQDDSSMSLDIFKFETLEEQNEDSKPTGDMTDSELGVMLLSGRMMLPTELELDLPLSQAPRTLQTNICLSTSELQKDDVHLYSQISLSSERAQREMEMTLWRAEKHPTYVLSLLLAEPQLYGPADDFQPLTEALKLLKSTKQSFVSIDNKLHSPTGSGVRQLYVCSPCEFTESMTSEFTSSGRDDEEFNRVSPEHEEFAIKTILKNPTHQSPSPHLKSSQSPAINVKVVKDDDTHPKKKAKTQAIAVYNGEGNTGIPQFPNLAVFNKSRNIVDQMGVETTSPVHKTSIRHTAADEQENRSQLSSIEQAVAFKVNMKDTHRGTVAARCQPDKDLDPLSSFIMLRSWQTTPVTAIPQSCTITAVPEEVQQTSQPKLQPSDQMQRLDRIYGGAAVSGNATREHKAAGQPTGQLISHPVHQHIPQDRGDSRVIQVQASDSQRHAYYELLAFAQPCLSFSRQLGLSVQVWGDFSCLASDQTHFLLKQQERALCGTSSQSTELVRDRELLVSQVALIHVLVTLKELLLKCDLSAAVDYLSRMVEVYAEKSLKQLLKKLKIILYLSHKNQETSIKLVELQRLLDMWLQNRKEQDLKDKILLIITVATDDTKSVIIKSLNQVAGLDVTALCPEENKTKLNGATVVCSVCNSVCVVVYEQHIGPDFPWHCFSVVVEYNHPGQSPWAAVCRERKISHVTFNTTLPDNEMEKTSWSLKDNVPYVLFVTEGLFNCPLLLQTLESMFNVTVLERSHSMSLQMLGGTHQYAVITVDESTAIVIQKQDELCEDQASEGLVMRLSALSLQYSSCWLILHCPDRQGGLSREAFSNLVLVYSSLVLFGMKSEDLEVKVLMVSEVVEMAKWICEICFHSLMASDRDPVSFLDRDWLSVMVSQEEQCLLQFPCINPLVSQLMLRRAPTLRWLLGASLSQLKDLLPEVPYKVLKLFSDTTSLYTQTTAPNGLEHQAAITDTDPRIGPKTSRWIYTQDSDPELDPFCNQDTSFLYGAESSQDSFCKSESAYQESHFRLDLSSSSSSPDTNLQRWPTPDLWKDERCKAELECSGWSSRGGTVGKTVESDQRPPAINTNLQFVHSSYYSPFKPESTLSYSPVLQQNVVSKHLISHSLSSSPAAVTLWGCPSSEVTTRRTSAQYGSKCLAGREKKRGGEVLDLAGTDLTPLKRQRLRYERVPGRSDGQTRLKLF